MTWLRLAKRSNFFACLFPRRKPESEEQDLHPPMMDLLKLVSGLPEILGKTIAHVVMKSRGRGQSQLHFVFTDDTHL